MKVFALRGLK